MSPSWSTNIRFVSSTRPKPHQNYHTRDEQTVTNSRICRYGLRLLENAFILQFRCTGFPPLFQDGSRRGFLAGSSDTGRRGKRAFGNRCWCTHSTVETRRRRFSDASASRRRRRTEFSRLAKISETSTT